MVKKLSRRDALKMGALGLGGGLLALLPIGQFKKKKENDMTIHIESFSSSVYTEGLSSIDWDHSAGATLLYPGLVIGVSIFGTASVVSAQVAYGTSQNLTFVRADTNGIYRSEIWYLPSLVISGEMSFQVSLSAAADAVAGVCVYNYFGGVGVHAGQTGTASPVVDMTITPTQLNSILFSNLSIGATAGASPTDGFTRWEVQSGDNSGLASDRGPVDQITLETLAYQTTGAATWALNAVELLDYQSNPPAAMGSGM